MAKKDKEKYNDLGLGNKASAGNFRSLNKNGTFNVRKSNLPFFERFNFFHTLISMSWIRFNALIFLSYFFVNLLFASIYMLIGVENLTGVVLSTPFDNFMEAFFFSSQTITTLGYGRVAPIGIPANTVAALESMLGLLAFALATGMLYGRFSKPSARIKYSGKAVIAPYQDMNAFMFRLINPLSNQLLEVEATVTLSMQQKGKPLRSFHLLQLERSKVVFLPSVWTIVHPIKENSPLHGMNKEKLLELDPEFIVMIKAFDESFSQTVYSRSSYKASEIVWGEKFAYIIKQEESGIEVDVSRIDETVKVDLN